MTFIPWRIGNSVTPPGGNGAPAKLWDMMDELPNENLTIIRFVERTVVHVAGEHEEHQEG